MYKYLFKTKTSKKYDEIKEGKSTLSVSQDKQTNVDFVSWIGFGISHACKLTLSF